MQSFVPVKCCHLQPAAPLLASCPSAFFVPSERRLTDKPSCLAAMDASTTTTTPGRELSRPSAGPDTTTTPTKQLFTPKHPEEEGTVLIIPQHRGGLSPPCCQRARDTSNPPPLYLSSPAAHEPVTSPVLKPRHRNTFSYSSHSKEEAAAPAERRRRLSGLKTKLGRARDAWLRPHGLPPSGQRIRWGG